MLAKRLLFNKSRRLLNGLDYQAVFSLANKKSSQQHFLLLANTHNKKFCARLGMVVSKKNVPRAVDRNRLKRCIREWFRTHQHALHSVDLIVMVRSPPKNIDDRHTTALLEKAFAQLTRD